MAKDENLLDLVNRGVTLMRLEKYDAAKELFKIALEKDPECFDAWMHLGNALVNLGEMEEAINAFSSALIIDQNAGEALYSIANVYYLLDDTQNAVRYYIKAENIGYHNGDMYLIMANVFYSAGDSVQALRYITRAIRDEPLRGELWRQKVLLELELGQVETALDTLNDFEEILPEALDIHELRTRILIDKGNYAEAEKYLEAPLARFPEDPRLHFLMLQLKTQSGAFDDALKEISVLKSLDLNGEQVKRVALEEAAVYVKKEDPTCIIQAVEWGLSNQPNDPELLFVVLNTYIAALDYSHIIEFADRLLKLDNISPSLYAPAEFYRALSLRELGNKEAAKKQFHLLKQSLRKITIDHPENLDVFMYRILTHCALSEYDEAFELADYLGQVMPDQREAHSFRALIYKEMGNKEMEKKELAEAKIVSSGFEGSNQ